MKTSEVIAALAADNGWRASGYSKTRPKDHGWVDLVKQQHDGEGIYYQTLTVNVYCQGAEVMLLTRRDTEGTDFNLLDPESIQEIVKYLNRYERVSWHGAT